MPDLIVTAEEITHSPERIVRIWDGASHATYYPDREWLYITTRSHDIIGPIKLPELPELIKFLIRIAAEFKPEEING